MKVTAISDMHGILPDLNPCDVLLICGDIIPLEIQRNVVKSEMWLRSKFADWINNLPCEHVIAVWGNHDFIGLDLGEDPLGRQRYNMCIGKPTKHKIEFLDDNYTNVIVGDEQITIWGSPWCKTFGNWAFMLDEESLIEKYKSIPKGCDIVITHQPPRISKIDVISQGPYMGEKCGSKSLIDAIKLVNPRYAFCGHIHSGEHKLSKCKGAGDTMFANVSLVDERYKLTYLPLELEV